MKLQTQLIISWCKDAFWACLFLIALGYITFFSASHSGYNWQWERALPYFFTYSQTQGVVFGDLISKGLYTTLEISFFSLLLALFIGLISAFLRISGGPFTRFFVLSFVQLIRNTPLMVQLLVFYTLSPASWNISAKFIAIIALAIFEGVYFSEIFRAGIMNIHKGQWEAALSLGLPTSSIWARVIVPQAIRQVLPPSVNQCVNLVKDSSLASIIAVNELSQEAGIIISDTFLTFEIWFPVAAIYISLALSLSILAKWLEWYLHKERKTL